MLPPEPPHFQYPIKFYPTEECEPRAVDDTEARRTGVEDLVTMLENFHLPRGEIEHLTLLLENWHL